MNIFIFLINKYLRGPLVKSFVTLNEPVVTYDQMAKSFDHFWCNRSKINGANLTCINLYESLAQYYSNRWLEDQPIKLPENEVYWVTNNSLWEPVWPKEKEAYNIMETVVKDLQHNEKKYGSKPPEDQEIEDLLDVLLTMGRINK